MEDNPKTSPLYQTALRLISRVASTRETLIRLTHIAATEGRIDLALSLRSAADSLDNSEVEALSVLRLIGHESKPATTRPADRQPPMDIAVGDGAGAPK